MANPEMSSAQEQGLGAVPPQGRAAEADAVGDGVHTAKASIGSGAADGTAAAPETMRGGPGEADGMGDDAALAGDQSGVGDADSIAIAAPSSPGDQRSEPRGLPLLARVLLADLGVAIIALIALTVIEVQRLGDADLHMRRQAYAEDLVVLFVVAAVFALVAFLLLRTGHATVAIVQAVVTLLVLGVAITSAVVSDPKPVTVEQDR